MATARVPSRVRRWRAARVGAGRGEPGPQRRRGQRGRVQGRERARSAGAAEGPPGQAAAQQRHGERHQRQDHQGHGDDCGCPAHGADRNVRPPPPSPPGRPRVEHRDRPAGAVPPTGSPEGADPAAHIAVLPGVADAVERARRAVDDLRGHRVMRRSADRVAAESALRGARASAALAGADVPLETLRAALTPRASDGESPRQAGSFLITDGERLADVDAAVVQGALRVAAEIGLLRNAWPNAPLQVVARLHTLAAAGSVPDASTGPPGARRPRPGWVLWVSC